MTREEIERDILSFEYVQANGLLPKAGGAHSRALARLRADLAAFDAPPPEGHVRVFFSLDSPGTGRVTSAEQITAYSFATREDAEDAADFWTLAIVQVDVPLPKLPQIVGKAEKP